MAELSTGTWRGNWKCFGVGSGFYLELGRISLTFTGVITPGLLNCNKNIYCNNDD